MNGKKVFNEHYKLIVEFENKFILADKCFRCKKTGHWIKDCPFKNRRPVFDE